MSGVFSPPREAWAVDSDPVLAAAFPKVSPLQAGPCQIPFRRDLTDRRSRAARRASWWTLAESLTQRRGAFLRRRSAQRSARPAHAGAWVIHPRTHEPVVRADPGRHSSWRLLPATAACFSYLASASRASCSQYPAIFRNAARISPAHCAAYARVSRACARYRFARSRSGSLDISDNVRSPGSKRSQPKADP